MQVMVKKMHNRFAKMKWREMLALLFSEELTPQRVEIFKDGTAK